MPIEPPGLYRSGAAPGSDAERVARRNAAWPCRVAELRFCGVYLPAALILQHQVHTGWIVSQPADRWASTLYSSVKEERSPVNPLHAIHEVRANADGTYLLRGMSWDVGYLQRHQQDWIVGPVDEADSVGAAVRKMDAWLRKRYTGAWR